MPSILTARAAGRNLNNPDGMHDSAENFKLDGSGMIYQLVILILCSVRPLFAN